MKKRLTNTLKTIAGQIPLGLYPWVIRRKCIDFFWHAVSDEPMPHVEYLYPVIPVTEFETALQYLGENYTLVSCQQLHDHIFKGTVLPPGAVHISFDDGYAECFSIVRPILLKHKIPCTFFLTTNLIDNPILFYRNKQSLCLHHLSKTDTNIPSLIASLHLPHTEKIPSNLPDFISWFQDLRLSDEALIDQICSLLGVNWQEFLNQNQPYLTAEQIQQMHAEGFTLGAHTLSHRKLVDLPESEIETEIRHSCRIVAEITGQAIVPFSFPHSAWGLDRSHLAAIRAQNPQIGLLFDTKGLRQDATFIQNRVWAERQLPGRYKKQGGSRVFPTHLHLAYQEAWLDQIMALGRSLRG